MPELKFHDIDVDTADILAAGVIMNSGSVNLIAQGVTESQRVGRKCTIKSINWRYQIELSASSGTTFQESDTMRIIMYLDKQCNGATATITGILESANYQSFNNLANKNRFRTLYDQTHTLNTQGGAGNGTANDFGPQKVTGSFFKQCDIPIEFDSTTGAITEIRSNNLGVLVIAEQGGISTFDSKLRLRFSDGS